MSMDKTSTKVVASPAPREWSDQKEYEYHPLAELFPLMEGEDLERFAEDIATNGQKETVKLYEGKILDGRNRYRACKARGLPCRYENWGGNGDPWDYVLSLNLHRRHLTQEYRRTLAVELRKQGKSLRQIAETLHEGYGTVHRDLQTATGPNGPVSGQDLPATIKGKDNKVRLSRMPKGGKGSKRLPKTKAKVNPEIDDDSTKGERPRVNELVGIIHRGLAATKEAKGLDLKKNTVYFHVGEHRVRVTCRIV
jgi:hypothetical protein